jgi:hypothetical protein
MATPNEASDLKTRLQQAKEFLQEHDNEAIVTAAKIFKIPRTNLGSSIHKTFEHCRRGLNHILTSKPAKELHSVYSVLFRLYPTTYKGYFTLHTPYLQSLGFKSSRNAALIQD